MATPRFSPALLPVTPPVPRSIGKYDIQAEIGAGALVKVFRAFDRALGRPVTLKLLAGPADEPLKDRFRAQVALAGKLRSDSFIAIYDLGDDSGRPFAAMQVMGDDDLAQAIRTRRSLSLLQRLLILWQVSEGLGAAHAGGLEHVGVRPSGIALDANGRATVQDFGTVRLLPGPEGESSSYRAPEEIDGAAPDSMCDIFSFGAIAYELLAGTYLPAEPMPLGAFLRDCPAGLEQLVDRALHPARAQRYQSMDDLQEDLNPILSAVKHKRCASLLSDISGMMGGGRIEQAQPLLKEALQLEPNNRKAHRLRTELRTLQQAQASERKQRLDQQLRDAAALVGSQRYNRAIVLLCDLSREFRGDAEIARLLEEACELRSRQEAILGAADTCDALLREGEIGKAIEFLDSALAEYPDDPVLIARRKAVEERQREQQSLAEVQKVLEEVQWVLDQDRPDLAAQLLREKTAANPRTELSLRLAEIESRLPQWEEARYVADTLPRIAALEELEQWTVALTVLEEALQTYPASRPLLDEAERLRSRLAVEERRRKLNRRLDSIKQKMTGEAWAQALMLIEAAQSEFPDEPELERLRQSAEEGRLRAEGESIFNLVRQCLEDGEPEHAEELLKKGLAALPADPALLSLQQEVNAGKRYREEWRAAQVLFGRRQFLDAEKLLARLAAANRPEVDLLLQKVREARAATEEDNFYASGRAKAQKLIQQQNFEQAADLLRNLLSLFPGDVILQRDLQSIEGGQAKPENAPPVTEEPARRIPFELTAAPGPQPGRWRYAAAGAVLFLAGIAGLWKISRSDAPAAAMTPITSAVEGAPAPVAPDRPVDAPAPAVATRNDSPPLDVAERQPRFRRSFSPPPAALVEAPKATLTAPPVIAGKGSDALPSLPEKALGQTAALSPPPPPPPAPAASAPPVPVGGNAEVARLIYGPPPVVPTIARQNKIHGVIVIAAIVDSQGLLKNIQVVSGNPLLAPAAREAVQKWRYRPAMLNGNPVESKVDIKVSFSDR